MKKLCSNSFLLPQVDKESVTADLSISSDKLLCGMFASYQPTASDLVMSNDGSKEAFQISMLPIPTSNQCIYQRA